MMYSKRNLLVVAATLAALSGSAQAETITFSGVEGIGNTTQDSFTVVGNNSTPGATGTLSGTLSVAPPLPPGISLSLQGSVFGPGNAFGVGTLSTVSSSGTVDARPVTINFIPTGQIDAPMTITSVTPFDQSQNAPLPTGTTASSTLSITLPDGLSIVPGPGVSVIPLPAALPLFGTGLGALGLLGWRRKRRTQVVA